MASALGQAGLAGDENRHLRSAKTSPDRLSPPLASHLHCPPDTGLIGATRDAIRRRLGQGAPTIEEIAGALGVRVRTLQRRLAANGITYSWLVGQVRVEEAKRLLRETNLTHTKIAAALAYSDPAHFTRAFVRWTGATPRAYRYRERARAAEAPREAS